ncbi:kynureninase [Tellurirhabdus bombi]|uniref:kynureninase n=1 Tax=Tellurirhabdus bombi TaxID=2907205 RepID=UPI001F445F4A|nr:kynureninase [Tellurirhabdus bombi]
MNYENSLHFARQLDKNDPLRRFRDQFHIPERDGQPLIYFCGNSLGLQPKAVQGVLAQELAVWQQHGVEGWFDRMDTSEGDQSWYTMHKRCKEPLAQIVGAEPSEVCPMNNLTINMHLMLTSFYQPTAQRTKILTIGGDFPSDQYALETHIKARGYNPDEVLIEVFPRSGNYTWHLDDILAAIEEHRDSLALVMMSGLHYYTGQVFDMATITRKAHEAGALCGFDLAHAIGNIPLHLHDWDVDFAFWCSYKYLNSGPGGVSGVFVHEKHHDANLIRLAGWWGYEEARRFEMKKGFVPMSGADGWQVSTPTILAMAVHLAAIQQTAAASMEALRRKSELLTGYLEAVLKESGYPLEIMTPENPAERGSQLSLLVRKDGKALFNRLVEEGIIGDWREPDCIRLAPAPLYNTFEEVWRVGQVFAEANSQPASN